MKAVLFANTDWYLFNFCGSLALTLSKAGHELLLISPDGPYGARLQALGLRWQAVPMDRRSLNLLRELALLWRLWRLFRRERPDVVHSFTIKSVVYGSLVARLARVPARVNAVAGMGYVFTSNDPKARLLRPLVRALLKLALGGCNARLILQNPDDVALFMKARLAAPSCIRLIAGAGVDCTRFHPPKVPPAALPLRVLLAARLLWDKGLAEYVETARRLRASGRTIEFLLAGEPDPGNPASVPEATVLGWVQEKVLRWLGQVDNMPALYREVHLVVMPSYREGLPTVLTEAAASGCILVATDVPGCREVVRDGTNGLLVPARDPAALVIAISRLYDDPALRQRLAAAARQTALARFDTSIVIESTLLVYRELLDA